MGIHLRVFLCSVTFSCLMCTFKKDMLFVCMCLQETLENVKKCRNFLSTLIKLASSEKQSSETSANVKELVKNLLVHFPALLFVLFPFPSLLQVSSLHTISLLPSLVFLVFFFSSSILCVCCTTGREDGA